MSNVLHQMLDLKKRLTESVERWEAVVVEEMEIECGLCLVKLFSCQTAASESE